MPLQEKNIVIAGAGPAGIMAALRAAELGRKVILVEKNKDPGRKLLLSGKGRCNLTNACDVESCMQRFSGNGQFLRDAFKKFFNTDLMEFFQKRGVALKVERQLRVFPESGKSASIVAVLVNELHKKRIELIFNTSVKDVAVEGSTVRGVILENSARIPAQSVILATGGLSYSFTGSTGDGLRIARKLGHHIVEPRPGLVPLDTHDECPLRLEGLVLKNIRLEFSGARTKILSEIGELLFTGTGISGPLVLSLSGEVGDLFYGGQKVSVSIDIKPGLTHEQLDGRLQREFAANPKKTLKNILASLLPVRFVDVFIQRLKIAGDKKANQISQQERLRITLLFKHFRLDIAGTRPIEEAMVTRGGIALKEIDPRTMQSRLIKGLYFAGEMIDIDADTGGFNLQAAFSTGYLAGESAARAADDERGKKIKD